MKLSEYRKRADELTAKASELTRQFSLGGIAIIWLFKNAETKPNLLDNFLILPLISLTSALFFDLLHYVVGGSIWITFFKEQEKKVDATNPDPEIKAPKSKTTPIYIFYYAKIALMLCAYVLIIFYLVDKL